MKPPKNAAELQEALSFIMAGALNGDVKQDEGRLALNAATRKIELMQAETRAKALSFAIERFRGTPITLTEEINRLEGGK